MSILLAYHTLSFLSLSSFSLYHLLLSTRSHLKSPSSHLPRPFHPLPITSSPKLRHLPLLLLLLSLLLSLIFHLSFFSTTSSLSSLHSSLSLLLFLLLLLPLPIPSDLLFLLLSLPFLLLSLSPPPSLSSSDLQTLTHSFSASISLSSSLLSFSLAFFPRLFLLELSLASSLLLKSLWSLQTALSLYADPFIPDGCHRLLDVSPPATRCDLEETRLRAARILNLAFSLHLAIVLVVVLGVYLGVTRVCGEKGGRRFNGGGAGSYEALPTVGSGIGISDLDHVQMKALGKSSAQE